MLGRESIILDFNRFSGLSGAARKRLKAVGCRVNGRLAIQLKQDVNEMATYNFLAHCPNSKDGAHY
jgi:hypothetical protein